MESQKDASTPSTAAPGGCDGSTPVLVASLRKKRGKDREIHGVGMKVASEPVRVTWIGDENILTTERNTRCMHLQILGNVCVLRHGNSRQHHILRPCVVGHLELRAAI